MKVYKSVIKSRVRVDNLHWQQRTASSSTSQLCHVMKQREKRSILQNEIYPIGNDGNNEVDDVPLNDASLPTLKLR